jgi:hypothetical protein
MELGMSRLVLEQSDINWDGADVIENPEPYRGSDGHWYVFFSGNLWSSGNYATGLVDCGINLWDTPKCTLLAVGGNPVNKPYFGRTTGSSYPAQKALPSDGGAQFVSPGGMSVYVSRDGKLRATWHVLEGGGGPFPAARQLKTGTLTGPLGQWTMS